MLCFSALWFVWRKRKTNISSEKRFPNNTFAEKYAKKKNISYLGGRAVGCECALVMYLVGAHFDGGYGLIR